MKGWYAPTRASTKDLSAAVEAEFEWRLRVPAEVADSFPPQTTRASRQFGDRRRRNNRTACRLSARRAIRSLPFPPEAPFVRIDHGAAVRSKVRCDRAALPIRSPVQPQPILPVACRRVRIRRQSRGVRRETYGAGCRWDYPAIPHSKL